MRSPTPGLALLLLLPGLLLLLHAGGTRAASFPCTQEFNPLGAEVTTKAQQVINAIGSLKQSAGANLKKVDQAFWPRMGVALDVETKTLIENVKPVTKKRGADGQELLEVQIKGTVSPKLLALLGEWGTVISSSAKYDSIHALVPPDKIELISTFDGIIFVGPPGQAQTNSATPAQGVISHRADIVQLANITGKGVKVGVLSDSIDLIGVAQSSGDLPNVTLIRGAQGWGLSEGVAMLEIVHKVAPDAELYFATAFGSDAAYAHNILALAAAGCKVIVDNVYYFQEPVFEDGVIAQAINEVVANGVIYLTAAGNQGNLFYHTSSTWEGDYNPTNWTTFTTPLISPFYQDVHAFTPSQAFNMVTGAPRFITLHWSDPFFNAYADYDLFIFNSTGDVVSFSASSALAFEIAQTYFLPSADYFIVVARYFGPERFLSIRTYDGALQYNTAGFIFGHAGSESTLAIGAIQQVAPDTFFNRKQTAGFLQVEQFTSDGPRRVFYENGTNITPTDLSSTGGKVRQKPDFVAADGVSTVTQGFTTYYGTSAAVAHAAGIAALALSVVPGLTPAQFKEAAIATAIDAVSPGFDTVSGYGVLDALNLINSLSS